LIELVALNHHGGGTVMMTTISTMAMTTTTAYDLLGDGNEASPSPLMMPKAMMRQHTDHIMDQHMNMMDLDQHEVSIQSILTPQ
jgi:hypothetical protein